MDTAQQTTSVQTQKVLLERIRSRLIKLGEIDDFAQELFQLLNVAQPENPEITRLKREVSQLRQHKNEYMEAATETAGALEREIVELRSLIVDIGADPAVLNMNDALTERMQAALCRRIVTSQSVKLGPGSNEDAALENTTLKECPVMTCNPDATKKYQNNWTRGGQAKTSDATAAMAKFLASQPPKSNKQK